MFEGSLADVYLIILIFSYISTPEHNGGYISFHSFRFWHLKYLLFSSQTIRKNICIHLFFICISTMHYGTFCTFLRQNFKKLLANQINLLYMQLH